MNKREYETHQTLRRTLIDSTREPFEVEVTGYTLTGVNGEGYDFHADDYAHGLARFWLVQWNDCMVNEWVEAFTTEREALDFLARLIAAVNRGASLEEMRIVRSSSITSKT